MSGVCAVVSAVTATNAAEASSYAEVTEYLRWTTGKLGFTLAGLALLVAARYQWMAGGALRFISPLSVIIGAAILLIWIDALTAIHRVSGVALVVWLVAIGFLLATGMAERLFIARFGSTTSESQ